MDSPSVADSSESSLLGQKQRSLTDLNDKTRSIISISRPLGPLTDQTLHTSCVKNMVTPGVESSRKKLCTSFEQKSKRSLPNSIMINSNNSTMVNASDVSESLRVNDVDTVAVDVVSPRKNLPKLIERKTKQLMPKRSINCQNNLMTVRELKLSATSQVNNFSILTTDDESPGKKLQTLILQKAKQLSPPKPNIISETSLTVVPECALSETNTQRNKRIPKVLHGGDFCCVPMCSNGRKKTRSSTVHFHRFPADVERRRLWLTAIFGEPNTTEGRRTPKPWEKICSDHFSNGLWISHSFCIWLQCTYLVVFCSIWAGWKIKLIMFIKHNNYADKFIQDD